MEILSTANVTFGIGIIAIIFSVYNYFRNPQIKAEKNDEVMDLKLKWHLEASDKRFFEIQTNVKDAFNLAANHTHTIETKVDALRETVSSMGAEVIRLRTIIEERLPPK